MSKKITKAVIAAAGFGTRFLPQTKAMPKEMLPLVDKPIIQYIVEELAAAGIEDIIIVTGYHKRSIEDHFDNMSADLRANLKQGGKLDILEATKKISNLANFAYIRQKGPYGNATPVMNAAHLIGDEPFIYTYADDFIVSMPPRFEQMLVAYEQQRCSVLACVRIEKEEDYNRYGIVSGTEISPGLIKMDTIVEKPGKEKAPSNLASVSGYVLTPDIFSYIQKTQDKLEENGELYIQTAMQELMDSGGKIVACEIKNGTFYDTGDKLEYLKTVIAFGLKDPTIGKELRKYLENKV